ncbi:MAG: hypothetical protein KI790_20270 [Cyclobacteriaceae bacterium]|nr:hypothetical protein [Cyclobacteriaceae bacterium HetDA_MAG_MS6]
MHYEQFFMLQPFFVLAMVIIAALLISQFIRNRRNERTQMIEKGMNPFEGIEMSEFNKLSNLKNGILLLSLGIGLLLGHILVISFESLDGFITYLSTILISGGIGFIISYLLIKRP